MNVLELEQEIGKMARAMMTRNREIGRDLIASLRSHLSLECVAGVLIVSIERLLWFDSASVSWTIEHLIPEDVMQEIRRITTVTIFQHLIRKGAVPGKDMSVDAEGKLLLNFKTSQVLT